MDSNAAAIPEATAAAAANATLYTGILNDVFGQTPCRTLVQQAGTTRTVSGPAALSTCLRMRDELHPAQADVHFIIYSLAKVPDMTICRRLYAMINNDSFRAGLFQSRSGTEKSAAVFRS
jgi:hypothetical protein